ncbi:hypothetical protein H4217_000685 [Coemansia sp. RSA 1939]|nr:hypothetical protein H4217_000685 [Coemansia sp. RSA 1939]KAJ2608977.1 hypothetical protein EV177_004691 [Coemansia sp. RSA 1804]
MFNIRTVSFALAGISALTLTGLAAPDVAGTRTIVISLATGDNGQLIPFVIDKNNIPLESSPTGVDDDNANAESIEQASSSEDAVSDQSASDDTQSGDEQTAVNLTTVSSEEALTTTDEAGSDSDADSDDEDNKDTAKAADADESDSEGVSKESGSATTSNRVSGVLQLVGITACVYMASINPRF